MKKMQKNIAATVCICFLLAVLLSVAFITVYAGHECSGVSCDTCIQISNAINTLKLLQTAAASGASLVFAVFITSAIPRPSGTLSFASPISLKVQMNN